MRALRIQKIYNKLGSENVIATRGNMSIKYFTLSTKETVNDIDQRSQLLVLASEKVTQIHYVFPGWKPPQISLQSCQLAKARSQIERN